MKATARSRVWWPGIDRDIEETARRCQQCLTRKAPPPAPLFLWSWPTAPWQRIHVDFATHQSNHYLIVVDAHSKWPEVIGPMNTTTAEATTNAMRSIFARYGLPNQVVSDNGPLFHSAEYKEFLQQNGIQRILVSPYHPSSNSLAERFVQTSSMHWSPQHQTRHARCSSEFTTSCCHTGALLMPQLGRSPLSYSYRENREHGSP